MENKPNEVEPEKKKRGRKPKNLADSKNTSSEEKKIYDTNNIPKKRGRKPKGGTVVNYQECKIESNQNNENNVRNIILHLKCRPSDNNNIQEKIIEDYKFLENKSSELNFTELNYKNLYYNDKKDIAENIENRDYRENKENRDKQKNLCNKRGFFL